MDHNNCHEHDHSHHVKKNDPLLLGSLSAIILMYGLHWVFSDSVASIVWLSKFSESVFELVNTIWWGVAIGFLMISVLSKIPREFIMSILGTGKGVSSIVRATIGGVLLDLCSHGILMVGAKLYERGASAGQVIAFLVASPWNSFSLTLVLVALIGLPWTLAFISFSLVIAIITGVIFDWLVGRKILPENNNKTELPDDFDFWKEAKTGLAKTKYTPDLFKEMLIDGIKESRMVLRWILFGVVLASLLRAFMDAGSFETYFGPTLAGLGLTIIVATILEVCSEGSTPIAADILTRANAPGNSFAFLMTGVATDYTEIMILKETTQSWKLALFLPLITVPQVLLIAWVINMSGI